MTVKNAITGLALQGNKTMTDYCVNCGNAEASEDNGEYISFSNSKHKIYINRFVCYYCIVGDSGNE